MMPPVKHSLTLVVVMFGVWLSWSCHFTPFLLALGLLSCLLVAWMVARMGLSDSEGVPIALGLRPLLFLPWLVWEIARSNVAVARIILDPRLPIQPSVFRVPTSQKTDLGRVIYANSITLTPGTISLHVDKDEITVHALTKAGRAGLGDGEMDRRVTKLEGGS